MNLFLLTACSSILAVLLALPATGVWLILLLVLVLALLFGVLLVTGQLLFHLRQQAQLPIPEPATDEPVLVAAGPNYDTLQNKVPEASTKEQEPVERSN
jgi:hypothetical protein